jgi:hypothetical protein
MIAPNHLPPESPTEQSSAEPERDHVDAILRDVRELIDYARHYVTARKDLALLQVRRLLLWSVISIVALTAVIIAVAAAIVFLLIGLADGIGAALGHIWLGRVIIGASILLGTAGLGAVAIKLWLSSSRKKTIQKYEYEHLKQRAAFGHDVRNPDEQEEFAAPSIS